MSDVLKKNNFQAKPKMRIAGVLIKNKNGNIIGEINNDNGNRKAR